MKHHPFARFALTLAAFAPLALAVQNPRPPPAPNPAPAPTPTPRPPPTPPAPAPAPAQGQTEEEKAKERIEHARQEAERIKEAERVQKARDTEAAQEADRVKRAREQAQEAARVGRAREDAQEAERVQKARDTEAAQEADRVKRAREGSANQSTDPNDPTVAATAREMFGIEDVHRDRQARLERLLAVYRETGDTAKLGEVEALQAKENKRYGKIIESFKQRLGPAYRQFEPQLLAGQNRKADPAAEKPALKPGEPTPAPRRVAKPPVKGEKVGGGQ